MSFMVSRSDRSVDEVAGLVDVSLRLRDEPALEFPHDRGQDEGHHVHECYLPYSRRHHPPPR